MHVCYSPTWYKVLCSSHLEPRADRALADGQQGRLSVAALHPFDLECRWKDEAALWTFLAPSGTAADGPQVPYLQLI